MPLVIWKEMTDAQRLEAIALRPKWHTSDFPNFAFWIRPDGHVSKRGGHHQLTEEAYQRAKANLDNPLRAASRSADDLANWKPGTTFHL
jgi:hypothetical protein